MGHVKQGLRALTIAYALALTALPASAPPGLPDAAVTGAREAVVLPAGSLDGTGAGEEQRMLAGGTGVGNPGTTKGGRK
jgi:hypothetical protein